MTTSDDDDRRRVAELVDAERTAMLTTTAPDGTLVSRGDAEVVEDAGRKRELWNGGAEAWFPDGADDDRVVLLAVRGESAEYWDTPGGRVATLLSFAKAKATGRPYSGGDNERVEL